MKKKIYLWLSIGCLCSFFLSCDKDEDDNADASKSESLEDFIHTLNDPLQEKPGEKEKIGDVFVDIDKENEMFCECTKYKANESYDENVVLDPTTDVIYPGAILDGNSVAEGSYRQILAKRAPLDLSTNLQFFDGECKRTVENPTLSNIRSAVKGMLYDVEITGSTAAHLSFEIEDVYSEEQLGVAIGASVKNSVAKVSSKFNWNSKETKSRFLLKFSQVYYSVDVDAQNASDFFASDVTVPDLKQAIGSATTPVYVSSVKYGRVAYICIESTESIDEVRAALDASFSSVGVEASVSTEIAKSECSKNMKYSGTIIGGSGESASALVSGGTGLPDLVAKINKYIAEGGNFSNQSPGDMVAYTLRKLSDNSVFSVVNGTEYVVRNCKSTNATIVPKYFYAAKEDGDPFIYGTVTVKVGYGPSLTSGYGNSRTYYLFNKNSDNRMEVKQSAKVSLNPTDDVPLNIDYEKLDEAHIRVDFDLWDYDNGSGDDGLGDIGDWNGKINKTTNKEDGRITKYYWLKDFNKKYAYKMDSEGNIVVEMRAFDSKVFVNFAFSVKVNEITNK